MATVLGAPPYAYLRRGARDGALWLLGFLCAAAFDLIRSLNDQRR